MDRRWILGIGALFGLVLLGVWWAATSDAPVPPPSARKPVATAPKRPANTRIPLPAPQDIPPPVLPRERPEPAQLTPDDRQRMNIAVDAVLTAARTECLVPWLGREGDGEPVEIVFDAVLNDGRLVDVGLRSMRLEVPPDVLDCVADRAWYADWPEWDIAGELRLQRSIDVLPPADP